MTAPAVVGTPTFASGYANSVANGGSPISLNKPTGAVTGHALIMLCSSPIVPGGGWARIDSGEALNIRAYTRTIQATDSSTYSVTNGVNGGYWVALYAVSDPTTPIVEALAGNGNGASSATSPVSVQLSALSVATTNSLILYVLSMPKGTNTAVDTPSGFTEDLEFDTSSSPGVSFHVATGHKAGQAAGSLQPTWTVTFDSAGLGDNIVGLILSVKGPIPPVLTAVTPNTGGTGGGTTATLTGSHFTGQTSATLGGNAVTDFTVVDDNTITFTVPAHAAGPVDLVIGGVTLAACYTYVAPTLTSITPAIGGAGGGEFVTIVGTGFSAGMTVELDGTTLTTITIVDSTTITGYTPAHADGAVDLVVSDGGDDATLAAGFRYSDVYQLDIALVKAGTVGTPKSDTVQLGVLGEWREYGGSTDLWDDTWTPAEVNASGFGAALSAYLNGPSVAQIDSIEVEVFYTVAGATDPQSLLVVMKVDADRLTVTPELYQLPRSGMNVAHDPNVDVASDGATFRSSRYYRPSRNVAKFWRDVEFWLEVDPETNVPGFELWAAIDEAASFQLLDTTGAAATLSSDGAHRLYFPPTSAAAGKYVQLIPTIPTRAGTQQAMSARIRDMVLHGVWQPVSTQLINATFRLAARPLPDGTLQRRSNQAQRQAMSALANSTDRALAYRDPNGETGYLYIETATERWVTFKGGDEPELVAVLQMRVLNYAD